MSKRNEYEIGENKNPPRRGHGGPGGGPGRGMVGGEKPKDFSKSWGKLINFCKPFMPAVVVALVCALLGAVTTLIGPDKIKDITTLISKGIESAGIDLDAVVEVCVTLAAIYLAGALLVFIQGWIMATVTQKVSKGLRSGISAKINRLPLRYFDSNSYGDILSRVTNDVDTISQSLNQSVSTLVTSVTLFVGAIFMMYRNNALMATAAILSTLAGFVLMMFIIKKSQKHFVRNQKYLGEINGHIEETFAGHTIVKAYNGEKAAKERFEEINEELYVSGWKSQFISGLMMPLMGFIGNFGYVVVCVIGAVLVMNNKIEIGVIAAFMIYIRLFTQPLQQIAQAATSLQSTAAAAERVFELLDEEELSDESGATEHLDTAEGAVSFKNVKFGYNADKTIIKNFSADVKPGQKVAIVGPTGAGKTTMVNLLMRFYDIDNGEITIDGVPVSKMTRENVHSLFCMVLQDTWLFEGTILENVVYSMEGVTYEDVVAACKAVGLDHFIRTLPQGYNTVLNDKANLSAGQKQLLTIARAMIENAPLLILDEATSSVDTRTEVLVQEAMDKLTEGRTSFVIAHRLSTIRNADMILVMREGDIVESGNHEELLAKGGFYAELYNSQFEEAS